MDLLSRLTYMIFEVLYGVYFGTKCFHALSGSTRLRNADFYPSVYFYAFSRYIFSVARDQNGQVFPGIFCVLRSRLQQKNDSELSEKAAVISLRFGPFCFQLLFKVSRFWSLTLRVKYSTFRTKSTIRYDASFLLTFPVKMSCCFHALSCSTRLQNADFYPSVYFCAFSRHIFSVARDQNGQVFPGIFVFLRSWLQQKKRQ